MYLAKSFPCYSRGAEAERSYDIRRSLARRRGQHSSLEPVTAGSAGRALDEIVDAMGSRSRPEISWISKVMGIPVERAEGAVYGITHEKEPIMELAKNIARTGRSYYAQFPAPIELYALVRLSHPKNLVESGVASGVSSASMLLGIRANRNGVLHSIDMPVFRVGKRGGESWAIPQGMSSGWAVPMRLRKGWDLREGRSEMLLEPLLDKITTLDFYCHDSPVDVAHFAFEMKTIRNYLKPGSVVVADNTDRDTFDRTARLAGAIAYYRRGSSLGGFRVP